MTSKIHRGARRCGFREAGKMPDQRGQGGDPDGIRRLPVLRGLSRSRIFAGTLDEAEEAGYDFSASFVDSKGNEVSVEDAVKGVKHVRVIVCEEPLEIVTEDPVLCVSGTAVIKGKTRWIRPASGPQSPQRVLLRHHQSRLRQKKQSRNMSRTFFLPVLLLLFMVSKQIK